MDEKANLTPWHLSTITERSRIILNYIDGLTDLIQITRTLNDRGYIVVCLDKKPTDVCIFLFNDGNVYLKVFQGHLENHFAWYVEILSKESLKLA